MAQKEKGEAVVVKINLSLKKLIQKIKNNHLLVMLICCAIPIILLIVLISFFKIDNKYLVWSLILLCPIIHYFMMKDMHKNHKYTNKSKWQY